MIIKYFLSITFDTHFIEDIVHVSHYLRGPLGSLQDPFSSLLYFSLYYQIFYVFKIFFYSFIFFLFHWNVYFIRAEIFQEYVIIDAKRQ